jgi:hypothetical protein
MAVSLIALRSLAKQFPGESFENVDGHGQVELEQAPGNDPSDNYGPVIPVFGASGSP